MIGKEIEDLIRRIVQEEIAKNVPPPNPVNPYYQPYQPHQPYIPYDSRMAFCGCPMNSGCLNAGCPHLPKVINGI